MLKDMDKNTFPCKKPPDEIPPGHIKEDTADTTGWAALPLGLFS